MEATTLKSANGSPDIRQSPDTTQSSGDRANFSRFEVTAKSPRLPAHSATGQTAEKARQHDHRDIAHAGLVKEKLDLLGAYQFEQTTILSGENRVENEELGFAIDIPDRLAGELTGTRLTVRCHVFQSKFIRDEVGKAVGDQGCFRILSTGCSILSSKIIPDATLTLDHCLNVRDLNDFGYMRVLSLNIADRNPHFQLHHFTSDSRRYCSVKTTIDVLPKYVQFIKTEEHDLHWFSPRK